MNNILVDAKNHGSKDDHDDDTGAEGESNYDDQFSSDQVQDESKTPGSMSPLVRNEVGILTQVSVHWSRVHVVSVNIVLQSTTGQRNLQSIIVTRLS